MSDHSAPNPVVVLRKNSHPGRGCVVILGQARGGTSAVAGLCHLMGVRMGNDIDPSNMEAREFLGLSAHSDFRSRFESAMGELRRMHVLHGFKDPTAIDYWAQVADSVVDPVFVVVLRDIAAIAERQRIDGADFSERLSEVAKRQTALFRFMGETESPTAIVSYERLVSEPRRAFEMLSEFVVGEISERVAKEVHTVVRPRANMPHDVNFLEFGARLGLAGFLGTFLHSQWQSEILLSLSLVA